VGSYDVILTVVLSNGCTYTKEKKGFVKFGDVTAKKDGDKVITDSAQVVGV